jgi:polysaccharide pyruvyl transferase WcaK-like protein
LSTIAGIASVIAPAEIVIFDNGRGRRESTLAVDDQHVRVEHRGAWHSRRLHRGESLLTMDALSRVAPALNANLRSLAGTSRVLDLSGGDSFCDLYGRSRFDAVTLPKRVALRLSRPLTLLPQTYGPFTDPATRRIAADIVCRADQAWARDEASYERLRELTGDRFDPAQHRQGVDVAFALPAVEPDQPLGPIGSWLHDDGELTVGVNVSGLLFNDPAAAAERFDLTADYPAATRALLRALLDRGVRVVLVPHVRGDTAESDDVACDRLVEEFALRDRLATLPAGLDACGTKWIISRLAWFTGARMHATIAALSSGVPVSATAYSLKIAGVFGTCGMADEVADARSLATTDLVERLVRSFDDRSRTAELLAVQAPLVRERAGRQFTDILGPVRDGRS